MIELHDYQKQALRFALHACPRHGGAGLFLDMGLGKTLTSIAFMDIMHATDPGLKMLVVAPKLPACQTWADELEKFSGAHRLDWAIACGRHMTARQRLEAIERDATVTVINQENLDWLDALYSTGDKRHRRRRPWPWKGLVIDELSGYKSPTTQRFRDLKARRPGLDWVLGLTGTPAAKDLMGLWSQCYLLDGGRALGATVTAYRSRWFRAGARKDNVVYEWIPRPDARRQILTAVAPFCRTMKAADKLPALPPMTVVDDVIDMPARTRAMYDEFRREKTLELDGADVSAANAGVLTNKLAQFAAGCLYPDTDSPEGTPVARLDDAKLDELGRIIADNPGEPILVFYQFTDELERMKRRWPHLRTVKDRGVVKDWNAGRVPLLAAHPGSARFGLNLQAGGHIIVWLTLTWSLEDWMQSNARLHRQGQSRPVTVHRILEASSIDMRKADVLAGRAVLENAVMDELSR